MRYERPTKEQYRAFLLALQADAKGFPGGIKALADHLSMNPNSLANQISPDHHSPAPSLGVILEIINLSQGKRAVFALANLVGQVPFDMIIEPRSTKEAMALLMSLFSAISKVMGSGSEAAKDGVIDTHERRELEPLLIALQKATAEMLTAIRS